MLPIRLFSFRKWREKAALFQHLESNIAYNDVLTNLDGLSSLTSVGGTLSIVNNAALENVNGLSNLTDVGGDLYIWVNISLCESLVDAFIDALGAGLVGEADPLPPKSEEDSPIIDIPAGGTTANKDC